MAFVTILKILKRGKKNFFLSTEITLRVKKWNLTIWFYEAVRQETLLYSCWPEARGNCAF